MKNLNKYVSECLGTFFLVFIGTGAAILFGGAKGGLSSIIGISLAFGLSIVVVYYTIGRISGGHVNPAVSLAMYFDGRLELKDLPCYILAQVIGAFAGTGVLFAMIKNIPSVTISSIGLGQNGYGAESALNLALSGAIITEVVLTFIFVFVVLASTLKDEYNANGGFIIGGALTAVHMIGIFFTGTSVNPARSLSPAVVYSLATGKTAAISQVWVFILAPLAGALFAVIVWKLINSEKA
jgi:aquaporin Z